MEEIFKTKEKTVFFDYEEHMAKVIYETGGVFIYMSPTVEDMENLYND